ncbi:MAG: CNNM domain-containing protein, partial [Planctomycetota bacterium]
MSGEAITALIAVPALLALSAAASGSETALFSLSTAERARMRADGVAAVSAIERLLARPRETLVLILLLNMVVNVAYFVTAAGLARGVGGPAAQAVIGLGSVVAIVLVGEVLAKLIASSRRRRFAALAAPPLWLLRGVVSGPLGALDRWVIAPATRLVAPPRDQTDPTTPEELGELVAIGAREGEIGAGEQRLLDRILELHERRVDEVMRPHAESEWLDARAGPREVREAVTRSGQRWIPVHKGRLDDGLVGVLDARRFLARASRGERRSVASDCSRALVVPAHARLDAVLGHLRATTHETAVCVDEHGRVEGVVRLTDIVASALVGGDEGAGGREAPMLVGLGEWLVPGRTSIREWRSVLGERATGGARTVAGLLIRRLERL